MMQKQCRHRAAKGPGMTGRAGRSTVPALFLVICLVTAAITSTASAVSFAPGSVLNGKTITCACVPNICSCTTVTTTVTTIGAPNAAVIQMIKNKSGWGAGVTLGGALKGKVHITQYDPLVCTTPLRDEFGDGHCWHGVDIDMWYEPGAGDPVPTATKKYYWIQRFISEGTGCGYTPDDVIDASDDDNPYYPVRWHTAGGTDYARLLDEPVIGCQFWGQTCGQVGGDAAHDCPDPCRWGAKVESYLAFGTVGGAATGTVAVYEGVNWGFTATCVPEPISFMSGLIALTLTGAWVRKYRMHRE